MAPSRAHDTAQSKAQTRAQDRIAAVHTSARNKTKRAAPASEDDRDVYRDMISEATPPENAPERLLKKPKLGRLQRNGPPNDVTVSRQEPKPTPDQSKVAPNLLSSDEQDDADRPQQIIIDSEESDDEDMDWEQVGLDPVAPRPSAFQKEDDFGDISLEISTKKIQKKIVAKRKPATMAEKLLRLETHEAHILFLLFHVHIRNAWCNLAQVQNKLKAIMPADVISLLNPDQSLIQFGRSEQFLTGLKKAVLIWKAKFSITASGMRSSKWAENPGDIQQQTKALQDEMPSESKGDFIKSANSLSGSQDVGNQLFCALLRCIGVEARLVCSLQPLPFGTTVSKTTTPQKGKTTIYMNHDAGNASTGEGSAGSASEGTSTTPVKVLPPGRRRRLGQPSLGAGPSAVIPPLPAAKKKRPVRKLEYPVFWVEAFNDAYQKWVPVDAIVTGTVAKPGKLEPPASYETNTMTYVVAFEYNSIARDVTRRYVKAYNAKTRKLRVESTGNGDKWLRKALKVFRRRVHLDRDQVENAELAKKEASEGLPNNVQDFKDHPYYALERHLKRHEIIWPKREVGKINAGKTSASSLESVYRRSDVQIVRSADKWYRFGREIKSGEQALKHVPARSQKGRLQDLDDADMEEQPATALYAFSQTALYIPPPVIRGRIPKNGYGNLDVYVPSMVPPGGYHVRHSLAQRAARLIGIDYADAVTGFQFKGRHGTAVTSGVVVADEYREAVEAVIEGFEYAQENEEARMHSLECLRLWRRFMAGLRIKERLTEYTTGASTAVKADVMKKQMDEAEDEQEEPLEAGGFFPDPDQTTAAPTTSRFKAPESDELAQAEDIGEQAPRLRRRRNVTVESDPEDNAESEDEEEYIPSPRKPAVRRRQILRESTPSTDNLEEGGGSLPDAKDENTENDGGFLPNANTDDFGGGFLLENDHEEANELGGGFVTETTDAQEDDFGGGFFPETDNKATNDSEGGFIPEANEVQDDDFGGGFVPEDNGSEAEPTINSESMDLQADSEDNGGGFMTEEQKHQNNKVSVVGQMNTPSGVVLHETETSSNQPPQEALTEQQAYDDEDDEDDGDHESLLSHDPEDEDAEPEWLNSD